MFRPWLYFLSPKKNLYSGIKTFLFGGCFWCFLCKNHHFYAQSYCSQYKVLVSQYKWLKYGHIRLTRDLHTKMNGWSKHIDVQKIKPLMSMTFCSPIRLSPTQSPNIQEGGFSFCQESFGYSCIRLWLKWIEKEDILEPTWIGL